MAYSMQYSNLKGYKKALLYFIYKSKIFNIKVVHGNKNFLKHILKPKCFLIR